MADEHLHCWLEDTWQDQVALRVRIRQWLHSSATPFQRIDVYDTTALGRVLCLGGRIVLADVDEPIYNEGLTHPALGCHPKARRALVLGGGDGGVAREIARHSGIEHIDVVEIDQQLVDIARKFFPQTSTGLDDDRVTLHIDDAHRFVADSTDRYDIIIVDADQLHDAASEAVQRLPFATVLAKALAPDGILIAPLGLPALHAAACRAALLELGSTFAAVHCYSFTTPSVLGHQWAIAWCSQQRQTATDDSLDLGDRAFWTPTVHAGLFDLPRHIRRALGR